VQSLTTRAAYVLTIENLASFHDATRTSDAGAALLIFTGGMPSPAWRRAYAAILRGLAPSVPIYHWGDIDEGGFRIAAVLSHVAKQAGRTLRPWMMSPLSIPESILRSSTVPTPSSLAAMQRWAGRAGWDNVGEALGQQPIQLEQESLEPVLPSLV
jgi:hypothetical protein